MACSQKNINEDRTTASDLSAQETRNGKLVGYANVAGEVQEIEYTVDGEFAVFDEHVRVPLSKVSRSREASLGLTVSASAALWPLGIVPYVLEGDFPQDVMAEVAEEYMKAGIRFIPRTNQRDFLVVKRINPADPTCPVKLECEKLYGVSNSLGFVTSSQTEKMYFPNYHKGSMILVMDEPGWPILKIPQNFDFTSFILPEETVRKAFRELGLSVTMHELGHALGLRHEHAHPNAPKYIEPLKPEKYTFETDSDARAVTRFDAGSIMMYPDLFRLKASERKKPIRTISNLPYKLNGYDVIGLSKLYAGEILKRTALENKPYSE